MKHASLIFRAVVALLLMITFFTLALAASAGLLYGGYELAAFTLSHVRGKGILFLLLISAGMAAGGLVVLWSILPRWDRFTPPGPELLEADQPQLFKEVRHVASLVGQQPPAHVYLVPDVNAFVTERGGWMGFGSRRVMGLGLGLLNILNVSELRAVIAHEFGHFHGGDTKLGPWIYKTRAAIIRTVQNLLKASDASAASELEAVAWVMRAVGKPFEWFAHLYLRVTHAISRAQEYSADKIAVSTQGASALIGGLKKSHRGALAFDPFMRMELGPLLEQKRRPPLGEGFRRFVAAEEIARQLGELEKEELEQGKQDPYDTHPPLRERIRHAESLQAPSLEEDPRPAVELLADVAGLEARLISEWTEVDLTPIGWEESAMAFAPLWRKVRTDLARALGTCTLREFPTDLNTLRRVVSQMVDQDVSGADEEELRRWISGTYASAISGMLIDSGFTASQSPGMPIEFRRGETCVVPAPLVRRYVRGELGPSEWEATWRELGLADMPIGAEFSNAPPLAS